MNRVSFSFHFFLPSTQYKYLPSVFLKCEEKKRNECNTQKTVESKTGERTMTEDNNPSHENKGERSKDETENIKARERTNARKITTGESFLVVVAPFCFSSLSFSLAIDDEKNNFLFKSNRSRMEEMPSPSSSSSSEKLKTVLVCVSDAYFMRTCVARALLCCCC